LDCTNSGSTNADAAGHGPAGEVCCPRCGHGSVVAIAPPESEDFGQGSKIVLYMLSLIVPVVGIIFGLVFMTNPKHEYKHVGRVMVMLGTVPLVWGVVVSLILIFSLV